MGCMKLRPCRLDFITDDDLYLHLYNTKYTLDTSLQTIWKESKLLSHFITYFFESSPTNTWKKMHSQTASATIDARICRKNSIKIIFNHKSRSFMARNGRIPPYSSIQMLCVGSSTNIKKINFAALVYRKGRLTWKCSKSHLNSAWFF